VFFLFRKLIFIGDNFIIGGYDSKVVWFDLDIGMYPYKTMRYHKAAVRNVLFHKRYPLFATASDDSTVHVFHSMVCLTFSIKKRVVIIFKF
jgi:ribosome biogenesis protein ERB1